MQEKLLSADDRIKFLAVLPFNTPEECERIVKETAGKKGIIGYAVPSTRHAPVHHNKYMRLYRMIEETGMPLSFHAGYHWDDPSLKTVNRFLGMHALGFVWPNMVHLHELGAQRHPGPLPQAQGDLDRERASPGRRS